MKLPEKNLNAGNGGQRAELLLMGGADPMKNRRISYGVKTALKNFSKN